MNTYEKLCFIRNERFHDLSSEKERDFIDDVFEAVSGVPFEISDHELEDYLTRYQMEWIDDIYSQLT